MKIEGESYMPKHIGKYSLLASTLIRELVHEELFYIFLFIDRGDTK